MNRLLLMAIAVMGWTVLAGEPLQALAEEPLAQLLALSPQELETGQVKLTYLGPQNKPIPTLVLTIRGHAVDWEAFRPWHRPEHGNDEVAQRFSGTKPSFTVSVEELRAVIRNVKQVTEAINTTVTDQPVVPWLSITITAGQSGHAKGCEFSFNRHHAGELFILLRGSLRADPKDVTLMEDQWNLDAMRTLQSWGCAWGALPDEIPARDVTEHVRVATSGLRWDAQAKRFACTATLTNASTEPVRGPISLVIVHPSANVSLANAHGTTCVTHPVGREFLNVPMPSQELEPGGVLETVLEFDHEEGTDISFATKVLAGVGER